jgi:hypothetical protein
VESKEYLTVEKAKKCKERLTERKLVDNIDEKNA